jgi:hypothetical protein
VAITCWCSRYNLPGSWLLRAWGKMAVSQARGRALRGPEPVIQRLARRQSDSDPIETIRNLSPIASLEPAIVRYCQQTQFVAGSPMRRRDFLILLAGPATLPVTSPLPAAGNIARVGEPRREYYRPRFSRGRADHQAAGDSEGGCTVIARCRALGPPNACEPIGRDEINGERLRVC